MRSTTFIAASVAAAFALFSMAGLSQAQPPKSGAGDAVLLELFTSQGCSSCPPADELLAEYSKKPGIITLSFSVDYWNYLGWHDTLSSPESSERQRDYASTRGDGRVYTPQVVVNGVSHVNGANAAAIDMAIRKAKKHLKNVRVPVTMHAEGHTLVIEIAAAPKASSMRAATIWLAVAKEEETVAITRGENRGKKITYTHPVRDLTPIGMWKGEKMTLRLPLKDLQTRGDCLVTMLQVENAGPVLGVAAYERM